MAGERARHTQRRCHTHIHVDGMREEEGEEEAGGTTRKRKRSGGNDKSDGGNMNGVEQGNMDRLRDVARAAREAARTLQALSTEDRAKILNTIADELVRAQTSERIMDANRKDVDEANKEGSLPKATLQRLKLKEGKLASLSAGIKSIAAMDEPIGKVLRKTELADGLELEQVTTPIGTLLIIFEARPDALPQIASLAIRSGTFLYMEIMDTK